VHFGLFAPMPSFCTDVYFDFCQRSAQADLWEGSFQLLLHDPVEAKKSRNCFIILLTFSVACPLIFVF